MQNKFLSYLLYGNRFCGIEHTSKNIDGSIIVSILKQSKKELNLESTFQCDSIDDVSKNISKNQHAVLVVNNEQVLSKTIESDQKDAFKLVYKAFPNINLEDFYFEIISETSLHFISICRKDYVDQHISNYSNKKINIIGISIGNSLISTIKSFLNTQHVLTSNASITIDNDQIIEINKTNVDNENYDINGLNVSNHQILSFSAALHTILKSDVTLTNCKDGNDSLQNDFKHIQFFNQFLRFAGLLILGGLLINFFIFNHYFERVNDLKQVSEINEATKQIIVNLDISVSKTQKLVDDLLKSNSSKSSFYLNQIMQTLPKTLLISEYNFQPLNKRIKPNKPIELSEGIIMMSGNSNDSSLFSKWISQLEHIEWIEYIDIVDYGSVSNSVSDFEIKIVLIDD